MNPDDELVPGTIWPVDLVAPLGMFVVRFSALEGEVNRLIWHLAGTDEMAGRAITASIQNFRPRGTLLEWLASQKAGSDGDRKKLVKLARDFCGVAEVRNRLLHDEIFFYSHQDKTVGMMKHELPIKGGKHSEYTGSYLAEQSKRCWDLQARMQQYRLNSPAWEDDKHFP